MKKIIAISGLALIAAGCGGAAAQNPAVASSPTPAATPTALATPTAAATSAPAATPAATTASPVATTAQATASGAAAAPSSAPTASADPLVGTWTVDYGDPTVMQITESGSTYTIAVVPGGETEPIGVSCDLPSGTVIATFSATGPDAYSGQQGTWSRDGSNVDCSFTAWVKTTLKLSTTSGGSYELIMPSTDPDDPLPVTFYKA